MLPLFPSLLMCVFRCIVFKRRGQGVNYSLFLGNGDLYTSKAYLNIEIHITEIPLPNTFQRERQQWHGVKICKGIVLSAVNS